MGKIFEMFILLLAIVGLGIVVLPETYSLFSGQHDFYDITVDGNQIPCEKCHSDILAELSQPGKVNLIHKVVSCEQCHVTVAPYNEGLSQGPGGQFHAAAAPACLDCHNNMMPITASSYDHDSLIIRAIIENDLGCKDCHKGSIPGNFSAVEIYSQEEVHRSFAEGAGNSKLLKGANEACISCHTHVRVNISWTKATHMTMNAIVNTDGSWSITNISAEGNASYKTSG